MDHTLCCSPESSSGSHQRHIIFPAFSIGSSAFVATLLVLWRRSGVTTTFE